jgi:hypothetical protein
VSEDDKLVDRSMHPFDLEFAFLEEPVDGVATHTMLDDSGVQLIRLGGVGPVVLDGYSELCALDTQGGVLGDQHCILVLRQIQTGGQDAMVGALGVEHRRELVGDDPVQLYTQRAAVRELYGFSHSGPSRSPQVFEEADRPPGVSADLIEPRLHPVEFLDDYEWKHYVVFIEAEEGVRVGEKDTGVKDVGGCHRFELLDRLHQRWSALPIRTRITRMHSIFVDPEYREAPSHPGEVPHGRIAGDIHELPGKSLTVPVRLHDVGLIVGHFDQTDRSLRPSPKHGGGGVGPHIEHPAGVAIWRDQIFTAN